VSGISTDAWILAGTISGVSFVVLVVIVLRAPAAMFHQVSAELAASTRKCEELQVQLLEERTRNAGRAFAANNVGQLMERLRVFPEDMPVVARYDCGTAGGSVVQVEIGTGPDDDRESVVLIVE
jgi:hypothetical protein